MGGLPDLATDRRGAAVKHSGNGPLAHAAQQTDLDVGAFFETEFVVRHGDTVQERSGVALSFCGRRGLSPPSRPAVCPHGLLYRFDSQCLRD